MDELERLAAMIEQLAALTASLNEMCKRVGQICPFAELIFGTGSTVPAPKRRGRKDAHGMKVVR